MQKLYKDDAGWTGGNNHSVIIKKRAAFDEMKAGSDVQLSGFLLLVSNNYVYFRL
jgi:hypothetical protein